MNDWNFDPLEISVLALVGALYWRRARTLARRGRPVPAPRLAAFAAGLVTIFVALASPIDTIGEERLFSVHMLQHLLLGDVGALLLVLGLDGRLLRPLLSLRLVHPLRVLVHPAPGRVLLRLLRGGEARQRLVDAGVAPAAAARAARYGRA